MMDMMMGITLDGPGNQDDWMMIKTWRIMLRRRIDDRND